uniref:Vesicle transport protein USE1 n=1 Tax=Hyaloperonospora arabidopsidis (strain Emoy2) TaxID=559515 RepID=M4BJX1_HYAAE
MEVIECRRFLAAWTRSKADKEIVRNDHVLIQYEQLALHYQQLLQDKNEFEALESDLASLLAEIKVLKQETQSVTPPRILRASEITKLREERHRAAAISSRLEAPVKKQELVLESCDNEKEGEICVKPEMHLDLTANDLKSILDAAAPREEKPSAKAIRQRLGLMDRSKAHASASETVAQEEQESIQSEMMSLAKQLKDRTQIINQSLLEDVKILDAVGESAESNAALLDRENTMLKKQLAASIGLWTSLWLVAMLFVVFVVTYFYMKMFSRRW